MVIIGYLLVVTAFLGPALAALFGAIILGMLYWSSKKYSA